MSLVSMVRSWRIGTRITFSFGAILLIILALNASTLRDLAGVRSLSEELRGPSSELLELAEEWKYNIGVNGQRNRAVAHANEPALAAYFAAEIQRMSERTTQVQKRVTELERTPQGLALLQKMADIRKDYLVAREPVLKRTPGEPEDVTKTNLARFEQVSDSYLQVAAEFAGYQRSQVKALGDQVDERMNFTFYATLATTAASVIVSTLLGMYLKVTILKPLEIARNAANRIAQGDLSKPMPDLPQDEAGQVVTALASMQERLREVVADIRQAADSIQTSSGEVAAGNADLSARTEESAANLEETAAAVEQLNSTVAGSAESAGQAHKMAEAATQAAQDGKTVVDGVVGAMEGINESSRQIQEYVAVIDGVAFQTNILALNAAIEAARAGEHGRGFAVVAGEVRNLAKRSSAAAKEIKDLVTKSVEDVAKGVTRASAAGQNMLAITDRSGKVATLLSDISLAASNQATGIGEVNVAVTRLDQVTQANAALVEQSTAAAESLRQQADNLSGLVRQFKTA